MIRYVSRFTSSLFIIRSASGRVLPPSTVGGPAVTRLRSIVLRLNSRPSDLNSRDSTNYEESQLSKPDARGR
jgi:hypothetical protein